MNSPTAPSGLNLAGLNLERVAVRLSGRQLVAVDRLIAPGDRKSVV